MKKLISRILTAALSVSLMVPFAGCEKESNVTKVTCWTGDSHAKAVMTKLVQEFNNTIGKENNVEFEYIVKDGTTMSNMDLALENGEAPDLISGGQLEKWVDNGYLMPIAEMPGGEEFLKRYEGNLVETWHTFDGVAYTVPNALTTMGLVYNKDMFKEAGIVDANGEPTPPETLEQVREYAKKLTNAKEKKYGIIFPCKWSTWFGYDVSNTVISSFGHKGYNPATGKYDMSVLKPMIEMVMGIKNDGSCYPGAESMENDAARARFADGNIGMKYAYSWDVGVFNDQFPAQCDWGVAPLPVVDINNKYMQNAQPSWAPYINKKSVEEKGADAIMLVYKWLNSDETCRKLYEGGVYIPWDYSITEGVDLTNAKNGWKEFGDMVKISRTQPVELQRDVASYAGLTATFFKKIWGENGSIDDMLSEATKVYNEGVKRYQELHPEYDPSPYIIPDWNIERKD